MSIREIWPEPPLRNWKREEPEIPENVVVFGKKIENENAQKGKRKLSEVVREVVDEFVQCLERSVEIRRARDIKMEIERISSLYEEAVAIIQGYRKREAEENIRELIKSQIRRKRELIESLNIKEIG